MTRPRLRALAEIAIAMTAAGLATFAACWTLAAFFFGAIA